MIQNAELEGMTPQHLEAPHRAPTQHSRPPTGPSPSSSTALPRGPRPNPNPIPSSQEELTRANARHAGLYALTHHGEVQPG